MTPQTIITDVTEATVYPSLTYQLDTINHRLIGKIDGKDAIMQTIKKILSTDRYAYEIYDWYYGQQLIELVGKDFAYAEAEIPRIINEALLQDDRITEIANFEFEKTDSESLTVTFLVKTVFGNLDYNMEIRV